MSKNVAFLDATCMSMCQKHGVEVERLDATLQLFQLPVSQLTRFVFCFPGWFVQGNQSEIQMSINISRVNPYMSYNFKNHIEATIVQDFAISDFQTQFNTPAVYSMLIAF